RWSTLRPCTRPGAGNSRTREARDRSRPLSANDDVRHHQPPASPPLHRCRYSGAPNRTAPPASPERCVPTSPPRNGRAPGPQVLEHPMIVRMTNRRAGRAATAVVLCRSEEHTSELQSRENLVCRLLLEKKKLNDQDILY